VKKERSDGFVEIEERFAGHEVYDRNGEKIGKVDDLFVDEHDQPEYVGVKMGFLGLKSTLIPMEVARVDEGNNRVEVSAEKDRIKEGPAFDDDWEIAPPFEESVRQHYGLAMSESAAARGAYGSYHEDVGEERQRVRKEPVDEAHRAGAEERARGETFAQKHPTTNTYTEDASEVSRRSREEQHPPEAAVAVHGRGADALRDHRNEDDDELRVQRAEEELRAGTREREAGKVNVRKRVRTDREQVRVPKRHEEVSVDRVPVNEEGSGAQIGEGEVSVPVVEDEVVVEKRPVAKEEIRVRKEVVRDEEIVEEDVRKEEIDVDDQTISRRRRQRREQ
jgi:uncharacterized protein (TIGR02271 family)